MSVHIDLDRDVILATQGACSCTAIYHRGGNLVAFRKFISCPVHKNSAEGRHVIKRDFDEAVEAFSMTNWEMAVAR